MADKNQQPAISQLLLERYALDELPKSARADVERRLAADPEAQKRLEEIRRSSTEILTAYPPETMVPSIERRARRDAAERQAAPRRSYSLLWPLTSALAVAALLVVILRPPTPPPDGGTPGGLEPTRLKGQKPVLLIFAKPRPGESPQPLQSGATVRARTLLQMAYVGAGRPHGVVLSIDGRGAVTLHHPSDASRGAQLEPGQVSLPNAYELDDAPLFERFFFVTGKTPIDVAAVMAAAKKLAADQALSRTAPLELPAGLEQISTLLVKTGAGEGTGP
jgi:hypothetical protein